MKNFYTSRPVVLCFSGHDPSGGAGLQADIEAITAQRCHPVTTVTALTIQDSQNVYDFRVVDTQWVKRQALTIIQDMPIAAIKLGMMGSIEMAQVVLEIIQALPINIPLICDPVLQAGGGGSLGQQDVGYILRKSLFPRSLVITPNLPEARLLAELPEGTSDECAEILLPHCQHLLITGGHGDEKDVHNHFYSHDSAKKSFIFPRLPGQYHGSGCTLASTLAARIALDEEIHSAVKSSLDYTWKTLRDAEKIGKGQYIPKRLSLSYNL